MRRPAARRGDRAATFGAAVRPGGLVDLEVGGEETLPVALFPVVFIMQL